MASTHREVANASSEMPSAAEILRRARNEGPLAITTPAPEVDARTQFLLGQIGRKLDQIEIFLAPTVGLPVKLAALPIIGSTRIGKWIVKAYNRLFQRQQLTNRQLVDICKLQSELIERLSKRERDVG